MIPHYKESPLVQKAIDVYKRQELYHQAVGNNKKESADEDEET